MKDSYYKIIITDSNDKVTFSNSKLSKDKFMELYFQNITTNLEKHKDWSLEDFVQQYKNLWSKYKFQCDYIDTYGHVWSNYYPSDKRLIDYLKKIYAKNVNTAGITC